MCGIAGVFSPFHTDHQAFSRLEGALETLRLRGPDAQGIFRQTGVALGHRRLSIIDTSHAADQPMTDTDDRYTIVFNGEIFNFIALKESLLALGLTFRTESDTEVLLQLYSIYGADCLPKLNGFFAFAIYDKQENTLFIARDRFGIKPLYYYAANNTVLFASEMKALHALGIPSNIDPVSQQLYFSLNYIPGAWGMVEGVRKLQPGHYLLLSGKQSTSHEHPHEHTWYTLRTEHHRSKGPESYKQACDELYKRMEAAVERRMISDVPLGAFLSGGIDSSIVVALAARMTKKLETFSIGFRDEPHFDETRFAEEVANHCGTQHHVFSLTTNDLLEALPAALDYIDEPFADSSALAVYILSRETRKHVTVALSGDGGDELFAGYRKHRAEWMIRNRPAAAGIASLLAPAFRGLKGSRQSKTGNRLRQLQRFAEGARMTDSERYWRWCSIATASEVEAMLLKHDASTAWHRKERIQKLTADLQTEHDFNHVLLNDMRMVLPDDMLVKVDLMSMANSLEVRVPFLDYTVVEWAFSLPSSYKIDKEKQKKLLQDTFGNMLPAAVFNRPKKGFEVPLLRWFTGELAPLLDEHLHPDFIREQQLFNPAAIAQLRQQLTSAHPGDATARIWALIVFQHWWKRHFSL